MKKTSWFGRLGIITIITIYLVILAGGIVRSTGSGMGCPDWPKCFGKWIPPTDVSQLPPHYQDIYGTKLKGEVEFNATKTWTEYLNRLVGVVSGIFVLLLCIASIPYLKKDKAIFYLCLLLVLLMGFQGWLGSKVVSFELLPVMVTLHMLVAIIIVFVLIYVLARSKVGTIKTENISSKPILSRWLIWAILLSTSQVLLGTQVREAIDDIIQRIGYNYRDNWIAGLGLVFYVHRSFSLIILTLHIGVIYYVKKNTHQIGIITQLTWIMALLVGIEIISGAIMAYFGVPPILQPIHLTLSIIMLGIQFFVLLLINNERVFGKAYIRYQSL
jgi:heme a synthase